VIRVIASDEREMKAIAHGATKRALEVAGREIMECPRSERKPRAPQSAKRVQTDPPSRQCLEADRYVGSRTRALRLQLGRMGCCSNIINALHDQFVYT
jgi:hypothetical protein